VNKTHFIVLNGIERTIYQVKLSLATHVCCNMYIRYYRTGYKDTDTRIMFMTYLPVLSPSMIHNLLSLLPHFVLVSLM